MDFLSPIMAAELAKNIYDVNDEFFAMAFLQKHKIFSKKLESVKRLKAELGSRLINTKDGFGICVRGGHGHEKDIFIIFRGTTLSNYGADIVSYARIGVQTSTTGLPVHVGFNHAFCSMLPAIG